MVIKAGNIRSNDIAKQSDASLVTIKNDLKFLEENGLISKKGKEKATTYYN